MFKCLMIITHRMCVCVCAWHAPLSPVPLPPTSWRAITAGFVHNLVARRRTLCSVLLSPCPSSPPASLRNALHAPPQEVALDAEAWTGRVHAPAGAHITGQLGPQGQAPQLNGQWLVKDGGGGGIKGAEMTLDAPLSRGREERSTEYFREVALVQVHGGEWALENCTIACRHGVSIMAGGIAHDAANVKIDRCAVGGLYDAHVRREFYQFRIREVEDVMSAKDVDAELTLMEQDVVLAGGAAAGLWGRGNSTFVVADSMFQYAAVSANEIIRDDKNASLHHHSVEYDDSDFGVGDAQYAAYMQRLTEVLLNDNSTSDYILTEALPLPPRPRKKDPLPVGSAVFMQDRTR